MYTLLFQTGFQGKPEFYTSKYNSLKEAREAMLIGIWELLNQRIFDPNVISKSELSRFGNELVKNPSADKSVSTNYANIIFDGKQFNWIISKE